MNVRQALQEKILLLDGGTGTLLQAAGLPLGELPERWNVTHAEEIVAIHRGYYNVGSHIVCTNTFGANRLKFNATELEEIVAAAVRNARRAAETSSSEQEKYVALDIGPTGKLLQPYGDYPFEEAVETFAEVVRLGVKYGVDLLFIETMSDSLETKAAVLAAKENSDLPVFVSNAYGADGKLMTGATPAAMVATLEGLGVDAIGANCSVGPKQLQGVVDELLRTASVPVLVKPNAGLPKTDGNGTYYDVTEEEFAAYMQAFVRKGARVVGGCCGTTPSYIAKTARAVETLAPLPLTKKNITCVSSYTHAVEFTKPLIIGERINPTGKKRFKQALLDGDTSYAAQEAVTQTENGAHVLDVNVGLPGIDEAATLPQYVQTLQSIVDTPLQIDTSSVEALERALRVYNGKPLVNSVNGKEESMERVLPLVKKYGGVVVALTLDEDGIPDSVEGRVRIAKRIIDRAQAYGIDKKDVIVDTLTMSVATDPHAADVTLGALRCVRERLGVHTVLGVSNVSFGLPSRDTINATFLARALENGLSAAILNPSSLEMQKTYHAYLALTGADESCGEYIRFATEQLTALPTAAVQKQAATEGKDGADGSLQTAVVKGLKEGAAAACERLLQTLSPLEIIEKHIVVALDTVGKAYEEKRAYLPQLLMSAEAAKAAFERIREHLLQTGGEQTKKCEVVLATVQGDIHDIGKNIVKTLMENYGFAVVDLGKDVPVERVVEETVRRHAPIVGLSALMTTTLPSMQRTIEELRLHAPWCKIIVGGAVLNEEYARTLGADAYGKDALASVRYAESVYRELCKKV